MKLLPRYPYIIQQTGYENIQTHQLEAAILIQHQVLITNLQGSVQQLQGRINNQILGVKGLIEIIFFHQIPPLPPKPMTTVSAAEAKSKKQLGKWEMKNTPENLRDYCELHQFDKQRFYFLF